MVVKTLNEDSFGKITYDEEKSLLTLEWLEATKDMIAPHFQGILYLLAGYALQKKSKTDPGEPRIYLHYIMKQGLRTSASFFLQALKFHRQMNKICLKKNFQRASLRRIVN